MVAHCKITWNPRLLVADVDDFPYVLFNVVGFTDISDLFWRKLDPSAENVNELGI